MVCLLFFTQPPNLSGRFNTCRTVWRCPISSGPLMRMASRSGRNLTSYNHSTLHTMRLYHITRRRHSITHTLSTCIHRCSTIRHKLLTILVLSLRPVFPTFSEWNGKNILFFSCDRNLVKTPYWFRGENDKRRTRSSLRSRNPMWQFSISYFAILNIFDFEKISKAQMELLTAIISIMGDSYIVVFIKQLMFQD